LFSKNDPMKAYMQDIGEIPLITKDEEVELAARIKRGDEAARQKLIKANLRLVVKIAHDFKGFGLPLLDLISEGNIGLMRAAEKFDPAKGAKFSSYSAWWIKQSMRRALSQKSRTIRIPVASAVKINKIRTAKISLTEELGRMPTDTEIADKLMLTKRTVSGLKNADFKTFSLHDPIQKGEDGSFEEIIADAAANTPDEIIEDNENIQRLRALVQKLDERERRILVLRYGLDGGRPKTLEEVSRQIGRTRERVRQIQMQSLKKLRGLIEDDIVFYHGKLTAFGGLWQVLGQNSAASRLLAALARGEQVPGMSANGLTMDAVDFAKEPWRNPALLGYQRKDLMNSQTPITALRLSTRSRNSLTVVGIETIGQLASKPVSELQTIRYFGEKCLAEVRDAIERYDGQSQPTRTPSLASLVTAAAV
jgi:RNA polymerase primary sigma factor